MLRISSPFQRMNLRFMDRDAEGIEFAIVVPATQKRLLLLLRIHYVHGGEFAIHTLVSSKVPSMRSWVLSTIILARNAYNEAMLSTVS